MNFLLLFSFWVSFFQNKEVPFKPSSEYEIQIDYQFKQRSGASDASTIDYTETREDQDRKRYGTGIRPYLILNLKLIKLSEQEVKVKAINNIDRIVFNKKAKVGELYKIDLGFTDDVKAHVSPHEVTILFISQDKKETSRIHMFVREDGTFLVNNEVRGKF